MTDQQARQILSRDLPGFKETSPDVQGIIIDAYLLGRLDEQLGVKESTPAPPKGLAAQLPGASSLQKSICDPLNKVFNNEKR
jgi:hypothetical protein